MIKIESNYITLYYTFDLYFKNDTTLLFMIGMTNNSKLLWIGFMKTVYDRLLDGRW